MRAKGLVLAVLLLVGLAVPASAQMEGEIEVTLGFADPAGIESRTVGLGFGAFKPTPTGSFFDVFFEYTASAPIPPDGIPDFRAVAGDGSALRLIPGAEPGKPNAEMLLVANIFDLKGNELLPAVQIPLLGTVNLDDQRNPQVPGSLLDLIGPVPITPTLTLTRHTVRGPEPSALLLLGAGLVGVGAAAAWRRRRS